jgi:hypothetical protein
MPYDEAISFNAERVATIPSKANFGTGIRSTAVQRA